MFHRRKMLINQQKLHMFILTCLLMVFIGSAHRMVGGAITKSAVYFIGAWILVLASCLFKKKLKVISIFGMASFQLYILVEVCTVRILSASIPKTIVWNTIFYFVCFIFLYCVFGKCKWAYVIGNSIVGTIAVLNYFVQQKRGAGIGFGDLMSLETALGVAGNYSMTVEPMAVLHFLSWVAICIYVDRYIMQKDMKPVGRKSRCIGVLMSVLLCVCLGHPWTLGKLNFQYSPWSTYINGYVLSFIMEAQNYNVPRLNDYSPEVADGILSADVIQQETEPVNVVVVMNEAFADFLLFGDLKTNQEVTPFLNSLQEDCIKGNCYVSVKGGNTANSEYEFLTGDSMFFYPARAVAYTSYMKNSLSSIASDLKKQGYDTLAFHPWKKAGWNRVSVYPMLGIEQQYFGEDIEVESEDELREFPSDQYNYEQLLAYYEEMGDAPKFLFNITMQNHSGYETAYDNFEQQIYLTQAKGEYPQAERYLSLVYESDKALEYLINELDKKEEKVVLCFFGDHQPVLEAGFYDLLDGYGDVASSPQQQMNEYLVPFLIWANYDIEEKRIDKTSLNYLSSILWKEAGLNLSSYQQYLYELYEKYPVITANGVMDKEGIYYTKEQALEIPDIREYYNVMYRRNMSD